MTTVTETIGNDTNTLSAQALGGSKTLQQQINDITSAGWIEGGMVTDAGSETINIAAGEGFVRATDSDTGELYYVEWPALSAQSVPTDTTRYVYISYNGGNPIAVVDSSDVANTNQFFYIAEVHNIGGALTIHNDPRPIGDSIDRITTWCAGLIGTRVASGEIVTDASPSSRKIAVTAGDVYDRFYRNITTPAFDSDGSDTFTTLYRDGSGDWTRTASQTEWPNAQYDDGDGGLADMTGGFYANMWIIRGFNGDVAVMYGQAEYAAQGDAEAEDAPASRPEEYDEHGFYVAQITFLKSGAAPTTITTIKPTIGAATTVASASSHNDLSGLDGGQAGEYNHLTDAEYAGTGTGVFLRTTDPTIAGLSLTKTASFASEVDNGNSGAADTIDWGEGNKQKSTLTDNVTYTFTDPDGPCSLIFRLIQDAGGTNTVTWPAEVLWSGGLAPVITATGDAVDIVAFYFDDDGNYNGSIVQDVQ